MNGPRRRSRARRPGAVRFTFGGKWRNVELAAIPTDYLIQAQGWNLNAKLMAAVDRVVAYRLRHERVRLR